MSERFFHDPILNSPDERPSRYWELDKDGIPSQRELEGRRESRLITPIPKPRQRHGKGDQRELEFDAQDIAAGEQQYKVGEQINSIRDLVQEWRQAPESQWKVT
ncbi:MAG: restriction endonuclease, partial [Synechococcaceae cyanobacterium]|nr:restriction endonuclease [Synechococcaceae cyanobacterium]